MIRPPPLQLKLDNRFPQPIKTPSQQKSKSFVSQLYKASWKNPIIALAGLNGLRYAFAVYNAFEDAIVDDEESAENLFKVSIVLCAMFLFATVIEIYGIIAVSIQRLGFIRVYLYLAFIVSLVVTAAGVLKGVTYFTLAEELMWECVSLATEGRGYEKSLFRGHAWPGTMLPVSERLARKQCVYAWVHHSWSEVASVFIFSLIPSVIYYILLYTYYRQTIDPSHHANLINNRRRVGASPTGRGPSRGGRNGYTRVGSNDQANESVITVTTSRLQPAGSLMTPRQRRAAQQAPYVNPRNLHGSTNAVAGPSNSQVGMTSTVQGRRKFVSRSLQRSHRPPPLMQSPSPIGLTPGPPTYGRSKVYAAFAAPVESVEYDKFV